MPVLNLMGTTQQRRMCRKALSLYGQVRCRHFHGRPCTAPAVFNNSFAVSTSLDSSSQLRLPDGRQESSPGGGVFSKKALSLIAVAPFLFASLLFQIYSVSREVGANQSVRSSGLYQGIAMNRHFLKNVIIFISLWASLIPQALATEQSQESLIYKGQSLALFSEPLESYFDAQHPRPDFPQTCTGEWKGYHGTWEVKEGVLYLIKLQEPCPKPDAADIFSEQIFHQKPPLEATWVSGSMQVAYEDKGLMLTFDKGKLVQEEPLGYSPYDKRFSDVFLSDIPSVDAP